MLRLTAALAALALAGCAAPKPHPQAAEADYPVLCASKTECDLYWQRAQVWVTQNSEYRIERANDVLIQTYGPFGRKVDLAFQVLRTPTSDGGGGITIIARCDNILGCRPNPIDAKLRFRSYVSTGL